MAAQTIALQARQSKADRRAAGIVLCSRILGTACIAAAFGVDLMPVADLSMLGVFVIQR